MRKGARKEAERRRSAQAFQKAAENRKKKLRQVIKGENEEACNRSEMVGNKNYWILEDKNDNI